MPFDLVPISGEVTYDDGAPIKASSIAVTFNPIDATSVGEMTPPDAQTSVNVQDGAFSSVTTRSPGDGKIEQDLGLATLQAECMTCFPIGNEQGTTSLAECTSVWRMALFISSAISSIRVLSRNPIPMNTMAGSG